MSLTHVHANFFGVLGMGQVTDKVGDAYIDDAISATFKKST
jgi:hypothetical protein